MAEVILKKCPTCGADMEGEYWFDIKVFYCPTCRVFGYFKDNIFIELLALEKKEEA